MEINRQTLCFLVSRSVEYFANNVSYYSRQTTVGKCSNSIILCVMQR